MVVMVPPLVREEDGVKNTKDQSIATIQKDSLKEHTVKEEK
jgi:hypothetical protein